MPAMFLAWFRASISVFNEERAPSRPFGCWDFGSMVEAGGGQERKARGRVLTLIHMGGHFHSASRVNGLPDGGDCVGGRGTQVNCDDRSPCHSPCDQRSVLLPLTRQNTLSVNRCSSIPQP